jgi:hypothetical protein
MRLIFIYGMPATGKLTVAQELAQLTGYKLFHNHLVVDLLLSVFAFGSIPFVEMREQIWLSVFRQAGRSGMEGLIFTFAPEATVRTGFVAEAVRTVVDGGGEVDFVELVCPVEEIKRRLDSPSRLGFQKLSSVELFDELHAGGAFDSSGMPEARVKVDTSLCDPVEAARRIAEGLGLSA